jgi:hypothetical protein
MSLDRAKQQQLVRDTDAGGRESWGLGRFGSITSYDRSCARAGETCRIFLVHPKLWSNQREVEVGASNT